MGIIDKVTALLPRRREADEPAHQRTDVLLLREDFDRWLERVMEEPSPSSSLSRWMPSADVRETDGELIVTAEVPGLDPGDLDLTITPEGLIIRGEKREEKEDTRRDLHVSECRYGRFVRTVPLPPGIDGERAEARVRNGVLTVRFPKSAGRSGPRRVPVRT